MFWDYLVSKEKSEFDKIVKIILFLLLQEDTTGDYQKALLYLCGAGD